MLTHWHPDHAGSATEIGAWPGVQVRVHEGDAAVVRGERPGPEPELTEAEIVPHRRDSFHRLTRATADPQADLELICVGHGAPVVGADVARMFDAIADPDPVPFRFG